MGLFDKKIEACIAFIGKYGEYWEGVSREQEKALAKGYRDRLDLIVAINRVGDLPVVPWFFSDWSGHVYDSVTIYRAKERGFGGKISGEHALLCDEIRKLLIEKYGIVEFDPKPICVMDEEGIFVVLCRVTAKKKDLGL